MLNGAQQRLFLFNTVVSNLGGALEGILVKFAEARKLGEIAGVS